MQSIQASSFVLMIAFLFTFVSTLSFYRGRASRATTEQKMALRSTLVISLAFLVGGISSGLGFLALQDLASLTPFSVWVILGELTGPLFGFTLLIAVVYALRDRRLYLLPIGLLFASYIVWLLSPRHPLDDPYLSVYITLGSFMMLFPMILFGYLWRSTRRPTAFGMFLGILFYLVFYAFYEYVLAEYVGYLGYYYVGSEYFGHVVRYRGLSGFMVIFLFFAVMGLSFVYWIFRYSQRKIGGEIIGYSLALPVIAAESAIIVQFIGVFPIEYLIMLFVTACAAGVFLMSGSYLYGRYRESPYKQSLMLAAFSLSAGLSYLIYNFGEHLDYFYHAIFNIDLISLPAGMITGGFLFLAAVYALEWKSPIIVPPVIIVTLLVLAIVVGFPLPAWLFYGMVGAALALTILPITLFALIWRRMGRAKEKGRGRALGIFIGFLFVLLASPFQFIPMAPSGDPIRILGSVMLLTGSLIFLLGVSGRFDRWLYQGRTQ